MFCFALYLVAGIVASYIDIRYRKVVPIICCLMGTACYIQMHDSVIYFMNMYVDFLFALIVAVALFFCGNMEAMGFGDIVLWLCHIPAYGVFSSMILLLLAVMVSLLFAKITGFTKRKEILTMPLVPFMAFFYMLFMIL